MLSQGEKAERFAALHQRDLPRAQKRVKGGKAAVERGDTEELRRVVKALWQLLPDDSEARKRGFDSGVR